MEDKTYKWQIVYKVDAHTVRQIVVTASNIIKAVLAAAYEMGNDESIIKVCRNEWPKGRLSGKAEYYKVT